jgi:anaerobic ribonucleoside-triphosphate reductase activating protein
VIVSITDVVSTLLDSAGEPRDGVTVSGGEPFGQPAGLVALLRELRACGIHIVVYTGYTLEALARRTEPEVCETLRLADLLVDGPYVAALADGAGEWRGSRNQRLIPCPGALIGDTQGVVRTGTARTAKYQESPSKS